MVAYGKGYHRARILLDKEQHEALQRSQNASGAVYPN